MIWQRTRVPLLDWALGAISIATWSVSTELDWWTSPLDGVDADSRRLIYGALGGIGATAIGLFIIPVSIALGLATQERLARILSNRQGELRRAVVQAGVVSVSAIVFAVVAVALDGTTRAAADGSVSAVGDAGWVRCVVPGLLVLLVCSLVRIMRVLAALLLLSEVESRPTTASAVRAEAQRLRSVGGSGP